MYTKRNFVNILVAAVALVLPSLAIANPVWLYNDTGTPQSVWGDATNGKHMAVKYTLCNDGFRPDSVRIALYKLGTGTTVTLKIHLREDNFTINSAGCPQGAVNCDGPGTIKWSSGNIVRAQTSGWSWHTMDVPDCLMVGDFIVDIQIVSGGLNVAPLMDDTPPIPCCEGYMYWNNAWDEHYDYWGGATGVGHYMIRCKGDTIGGCEPEFWVSMSDIFYGHAAVRWAGNPPVPEPLTYYELIVKNRGGEILTINNITLTDWHHFYWTGDPLPWNIPGMQQKTLDVTFQTEDAGWIYGDLIFTHNAAGSPDTTALSGIGYGGHWLENFSECEEDTFFCWYMQPDSCTDGGWMLYRGMGYSDQGCCVGHIYTDPGCMAMDMLASCPIKNPDNGSIEVRWMNEDRNSYSYYYHGLYWTAPDCVYYYWVADIPPTTEGQWEEVGPYYIDTYSDSIQIAFLYAGEYADDWYIDDIMMDTWDHYMFLIHEHHGDDGPATWIDSDCINITLQVLVPPEDLSYVRLWYRDQEIGNWNQVPMTAVAGCEYMHLYEAMICDLDVCHSYRYYFEANDNGGMGPVYLPENAPTEYYQLDIMDNTQPQMAYDNGTAWYVRYDPTYWQTRFAVRFTPASYPYSLGGAMVRIGAAYTGFPDDDHEDVVIELYDDNGTGGKPGTMIGTPYMNNGTSWNEGADACDDTTFASWVYVKIDPCVTITDGDFYIAVRNRDGSESTDKEAFAYDSGPAVSPYRSWIFYADIGQWGLDTLGDPEGGSSTNLMLRAIECPCPCSPPTSVTILCNEATDCVELRWADMSLYLSYKIWRSTYDPFRSDSFAVIATVPAGVQFYADPIGTKTKAFYRITGSSNPPTAAPPVPPTETGVMAIGPVRRTPSNLPATFMAGQHLTLEEQLKAGIMPRTISKRDFARRASGETKVKDRTEKLIERFQRMSH